MFAGGGVAEGRHGESPVGIVDLDARRRGRHGSVPNERDRAGVAVERGRQARTTRMRSSVLAPRFASPPLASEQADGCARSCWTSISLDHPDGCVCASICS